MPEGGPDAPGCYYALETSPDRADLLNRVGQEFTHYTGSLSLGLSAPNSPVPVDLFYPRKTSSDDMERWGDALFYRIKATEPDMSGATHMISKPAPSPERKK